VVDPSTSTAVSLGGVTKRFGDVVAVDNVSLQIGDGEFFSLLGPSGSGKTTVLRMIAGFERPTEGHIVLHGDDVSNTPPHQRDVNTVFQDYALFPHMSVQRNVEYGLKVKGVAKAERRTRAVAALEAVRLDGYGDRRPHELSGGQRQRVALARALVNRPRVLLLDEPLGALDLKLREQMQVELKGLQHEVGITFIYVTHDQGEALSMSDRIAVFNHGRIEQIGSPREMYERPATAFVAGFVGTTNLVSGEIAARLFGRDATMTIRPERLVLAPLEVRSDDGWQRAIGTVADVQYLGHETRVRISLDGGGELVASDDGSNGVTATPGSRLAVTWSPDHVLAVADSGARGVR
jgi:putative spermidine/putrescine transport system ATP-binding protein